MNRRTPRLLIVGVFAIAIMGCAPSPPRDLIALLPPKSLPDPWERVIDSLAAWVDSLKEVYHRERYPKIMASAAEDRQEISAIGRLREAIQRRHPRADLQWNDALWSLVITIDEFPMPDSLMYVLQATLDRREKPGDPRRIIDRFLARVYVLSTQTFSLQPPPPFTLPQVTLFTALDTFLVGVVDTVATLLADLRGNLGVTADTLTVEVLVPEEIPLRALIGDVNAFEANCYYRLMKYAPESVLVVKAMEEERRPVRWLLGIEEGPRFVTSLELRMSPGERLERLFRTWSDTIPPPRHQAPGSKIPATVMNSLRRFISPPRPQKDTLNRTSRMFRTVSLERELWEWRQPYFAPIRKPYRDYERFDDRSSPFDPSGICPDDQTKLWKSADSLTYLVTQAMNLERAYRSAGKEASDSMRKAYDNIARLYSDSTRYYLDQALAEWERYLFCLDYVEYNHFSHVYLVLGALFGNPDYHVLDAYMATRYLERAAQADEANPLPWLLLGDFATQWDSLELAAESYAEALYRCHPIEQKWEWHRAADGLRRVFYYAGWSSRQRHLEKALGINPLPRGESSRAPVEGVSIYFVPPDNKIPSLREAVVQLKTMIDSTDCLHAEIEPDTSAWPPPNNWVLAAHSDEDSTVVITAGLREGSRQVATVFETRLPKTPTVGELRRLVMRCLMSKRRSARMSAGVQLHGGVRENP